MNTELMSTADIARERGFKSTAVARSWIKRMGLTPVSRDGDQKQYNAAEVRAAVERMPGRGVGGGRPPSTR